MTARTTPEAGAEMAVTQAWAVDAKVEYPAFQSWWRRTISGCDTTPLPSSYYFDAWMASARYRLASPRPRPDARHRGSPDRPTRHDPGS